MNCKTYLAAGVASFTLALVLGAPAYAQSAGSTDFDNGEIVVTGSRAGDGVGGVVIPDSPKAKVELTDELIQRQRPGQAINDVINLVPGVSFTNNDPFGSLGGNFTIRGFDSSRISQTVDGIPLNDSGNYALYSNQQPDLETLESVSVNLGSTDVDSPTASAVGGTVNLRTRVPGDELGALASVSYGNIIARGNSKDRPYTRVFGMIDTGDFTGIGTKLFLSASKADNESTFSNYGGVDKQQYNGRLYQELGGDQFVSVAFNYNQNRNNFNGSPLSSTNYPITPDRRFYEINYPCTTTAPTAGVADFTNSCGNDFERRFNPSNTGNIRGSILLHPIDRMTLTIEPSFQYVKANGGGTSTGFERANRDGLTGVLFGSEQTSADFNNPPRSSSFYYFGDVDLNGDGDTLDQVTILSPSHTQTRRYGVIANLAYDFTDTQRVRLSYTFDRARHRQTGTAGFIYGNGNPYDVFPINDPILDENGIPSQKRNRLSYATLNQVSAEYRGKFLQDRLTVLLGARLPFFQRELNQYCFTTGATGNVDCLNGVSQAVYAANRPYNYNTTTGVASGALPPTSRDFKYDKFLPNVGFTFEFANNFTFAANYAKNLSVPGTDDLYGAIYFPEGVAGSRPVAETSDSFDLGFRYTTSSVQAAILPWYTSYKNRLSTAYDVAADRTVTTNLGEVEKFGVDGSISFKPFNPLLLYVFGSYIDSNIKNDVQTGANTFLDTAGNVERLDPSYLLGARAQLNLGPVELGGQVKRTGRRYLDDTNTVALPGFTVVDLDVRYSLADAGLEGTYFQANLTNLLDEVYIGSITGGLNTTSAFANIGSPRAFSVSMIVGF
ncbi:TonB-dependent receptor [Novosphingopyxis sp.]|uniref:TonB-dependent receptor n=1 Tax=Novosphingopyxis sp. TaxID=2709690 RepID=UPI003B5A1BAB